MDIRQKAIIRLLTIHFPHRFGDDPVGYADAATSAADARAALSFAVKETWECVHPASGLRYLHVVGV